MNEPSLITRGLTKHFGGLCAVDRVSLEVQRASVHALLGPNGAGKSTLVNLLSGDLAPTAGSIRYQGREIAGLPSHRVSRLGIGRSYQRSNVFADHTCLENCWLAAQAGLGIGVRFFRPAHRLLRVQALAEQSLARCGLEGRSEVLAATLSHGERRQLEIAMVLATRPTMLLLDEPTAGMGLGDSARLVALIGQLAGQFTVILVEHDMDAVFAVADHLTVLVEGRVLASGPVAEVRADAAVQAAYLGSAGAESQQH
jgi:branched-chain amino acid transport system ATP-binding protein